MKKTDIPLPLKLLIMEEVRAFVDAGEEDRLETRDLSVLKREFDNKSFSEYQEKLVNTDEKMGQIESYLQNVMYEFGARALLTEFYTPEEFENFRLNQNTELNPVFDFFDKLKDEKDLTHSQFVSYMLEQLAVYMKLHS